MFAGTNVDAAKRILMDSGLPLTPAASLEDAAVKAVGCLFQQEEGQKQDD